MLIYMLHVFVAKGLCCVAFASGVGLGCKKIFLLKFGKKDNFVSSTCRAPYTCSSINILANSFVMCLL